MKKVLGRKYYYARFVINRLTHPPYKEMLTNKRFYMKYLLLFLIFLISCSDNETTLKVQEIKIGDTFQGGVVFHKEIDFILIMADADIGEYEWGCTDAPILLFNSDGDNNTDIIIEYCDGENAAYMATLSTYNKQYDWYLPSREEFELMLYSGLFISETPTEYYWTSSKFSYFEAICIRPIDINIKKEQVQISLKVRTIRKIKL